MTALAADRKTAYREGVYYDFPMAASELVYAGSLVALDAAGNLTSATAATAKTVVGRAEANVDNSSGAIGALTCKVKAGAFKWANSGTDAIAKTEIGEQAYVEDDQTVAKTGALSAGIIVDFDSDGVWVFSGPAAIGGSVVKSAKVTLTATQIKALATTPIELVAAKAGAFFEFLGAAFHLNYGSETLAEPSAPDDLEIKYVDASGTTASTTVDAGAALVGTADKYTTATPIQVAGGLIAARVNVPLVLDNTGSNYTGNASDDSTLDVTVSYIEHDVS